MTSPAIASGPLRGLSLSIARMGWIALAALLLVLFAFSVPARYQQLLTLSPDDNRALLQLTPEEGHALQALGLSLDFYAAYFTLLEAAFTVVFAALGLAIFWRRSQDPWVMFVAFTLVSSGAALPPVMDALLAALPPAWRWPVAYMQLLGPGCFLIFLFSFPDGRWVPGWTRWLAGAWIVWQLATPLLSGLAPSSAAINLMDVAGLGWFATGVAAQIYRYRRVSGVLERQASLWMVLGLTVTFLAFLAGGLIYVLVLSLARPSVPSLVVNLVLAPVFVFSLLGVPLSISFAILRYRLWDIDRLLNRTLVYGALTTAIIGLYVLAVSGLGEWLQVRNTPAPILLTTVAAVALFRPLRARLQLGVDRLLYGEMGRPHAATPNVIRETPDDGALKSVQPRLNSASLIVLLSVLGLMGLGTAFVWLQLSTPSDGARLQPGEFVWTRAGVAVTPLDDTRAGLRQGDVVVAVDGQSLEAWAQDLFRWEALRPRREPGQSVVYTVLRAGSRQEVPVTLGSYPLPQVLAQDWGIFLLLLVNQAVATYVFFRRPHDLAAQLLFLTASSLLVGGGAWSLGLQLSDLTGATGFWLYTLAVRGAYSLGWIALFHFTLVFPVPRAGLARRPVVAVLYLAPFLAYGGYLALTRLSQPSTLVWLEEWRGAQGALLILCISLAVMTTILSYRRTGSDPIARRQIDWLFFAFVTFGVLEVGLGLLPEILLGHPLLDWNLIALSGVLIPIALAIAILRYRLFEIEVLVNRALVYGTLTAMVIGLYAALVAAASLLFQAGNRLWVSLLATGVVAVLFQPLRDRFQRAVNRLMYGERDDPYAVLSRLGLRLEATLAPEAVLPALAETVAQALKLPYVAVALRPAGQDQAEIVASYGLPASRVDKLPLTYHSAVIGALRVAPRGPDEKFTPAERRLLAEIARQAGAAAQALRLTVDLQRSRERLVTAREEERRRLRRDLHDGLGPALAAQTLKVGAARALLSRPSPPGVAAATALLIELEQDIDGALRDIRRLVYDLRPPALDELGLAGAIRESAARYSGADLSVAVEAPDRLPALPAAVEVAAYRITQEALANVVRHAHAHRCVIALETAEALKLEIRDDGVGVPATYRQGVGLASMRERAEEVGGTWALDNAPGGGARVRVRLPIRLEA